MKIIITGGTGLVGRALTKQLQAEGHEVSWLSRSEGGTKGVKTYVWNVREQRIDPEALAGKDALIHLAGAGVADKSWTSARKQIILESRTKSTALLEKTLAGMPAEARPKVVVCASAIGIYGNDTGAAPLTEESPFGNDFLADVTRQWEEASRKIESLVERLALIRIGVVFAKEGGALEKIAQPVRFFAGAPLGSGEQYMSWVHIQDLVRIFTFALQNENFKGAANAVAPKPATNAEVTASIANALKRPLILPNVPAFALKLGLGEMASIVLTGSYVQPQALENLGFDFQFPELDAAVKDLLKGA